MDSINSLLPKVLIKRKIYTNALSSQIINYFRIYFADLWGSENLTEISSIIFKNSIIYVSLKSSPWLNQVFLKKQSIINFINKQNTNIKIKNIIVRIAN